jgi:hypothetical protein
LRKVEGLSDRFRFWRNFLASEKETSLPARSSLSPLALLGILSAFVTIASLSMSKKSKLRKMQQKPGATVGPEQAAKQDPIAIPGGGARLPEIPENSNDSDDGGQESIVWKWLKRVGLVAGIGYAIVTYCMYRQMVKTNEINLKAFETSERSYMVLGRKDGVVAEIKKASDSDGRATVVLCLQNAGRLPASSVCVNTTLSAWPLVAAHEDGTPLIRQRGKNGQGNWQTVESGCPAIGGDSVYSYVLGTSFQQKMLDQIMAEPTSDIRLSATIQHCDSFGHYACKSVSMVILRDTLTPNRMTEFDCTKS